MNFKIFPTSIIGCFVIEFSKIDDTRGYFIKNFQADAFKSNGIDMNVKEEFYTYSRKNVFRGMHFQLPPKDLNKIVFCLSGKVSDFVVDLRKNSPTYGKYESFELDGKIPRAVFVPTGLAHGFHVTSNSALMNYKVSEVFDKEHDAGISYKSFQFSNNIKNPILSDRDQKFIKIEDFDTPFTY